MKESKLLFKYVLSDAWERPITDIRVYNQGKENVIATFLALSPFVNELPRADRYTLSPEIIASIQNVYANNWEIFCIDEIEIPRKICIDGVINEFVFSVADDRLEIKDANFWAFEDESVTTWEGEEPVKAKLVLKVFSIIKEILINNGVDKAYLSLDGE